MNGFCLKPIILLQEIFLQFDWLRAVVFQLNLKYLHVKITNLLRVEVKTNNSMICTWVFSINTTRDISKLSQISLVQLSKTILKYHSWYLCQISVLTMLLPIQIALKTERDAGQTPKNVRVGGQLKHKTFVYSPWLISAGGTKNTFLSLNTHEKQYEKQ